MADIEMNDEQRALFDKLTSLQKRVVMNKIEGMNDIDAYMAAGGEATSKASAYSSVSTLLSNVKVKAFIRSIDDVYYASSITTRNEMALRLSAVSNTAIKDILNIKTESRMMVDPETGEVEEIQTNKNESLNEYKIKTQSQLTAYKQLALLMGYEKPQSHLIQIAKSLDDFYGDA